MAEDMMASQIAQFRKANGYLNKLTDAEVTTILLWSEKNTPQWQAGDSYICPMYKLADAPAVADSVSVRQAAEIVQMWLLAEADPSSLQVAMFDRCALDLARYVLATVEVPKPEVSPSGTPAISPYESKTYAKELKAVITPVIAYIRKHYHPHVKVIVDCNSAEVVEGVMSTGDIDDDELAANYNVGDSDKVSMPGDIQARPEGQADESGITGTERTAGVAGDPPTGPTASPGESGAT